MFSDSVPRLGLAVATEVAVQQALRIPMDRRLLQAARSGDKRILDELLGPADVSSGASVEDISITVPEGAATQKNTSRLLLGATLEGNTALHIVAGLGHPELAKEICQREISLLKTQNKRHDTPLHCAARAGDDKMVSLLIKFAREDETEARSLLRATNSEQDNALHVAAKYGHVRVAKVLMQEDAGLSCMPNDAGMSPLYLAIMSGSVGVARALLQSSPGEEDFPAFYAGPGEKTALHAAVFQSPEITEDILAREPKLIKCVDSIGRNPLHYAVKNNHGDTVKLLLERDPSAAYQPDDNGLFSIHLAAEMGHIASVKQILQESLDADELSDKEGRNFLHVAFQYQKLDMVKKIISKRPHLRKLLNDQDNEGNTPLHTAVAGGDLQGVHFLLRDKSVQVNIMNHAGLTPLDLAYFNLEEGLSLVTNASSCVFSCLALSKALFGPLALDGVSSPVKPPSGHQIEKELKAFENIGICSVLITAVTFAAGFTLPGGYITDDYASRGTAVLAKEHTFKVFVITDTFALVCSALATIWLITTSTVDHRTRRQHLSAALLCLKLAMIGMFAAFAMGIYAVLAHNCKSFSILLCFMALGGPLFAHAVSFQNYYCSLRTIAVRQGYKSLIYPVVMHPLAKRHVPRAFVRLWAVIRAAILIFGTYALFFLIAIIKY